MFTFGSIIVPVDIAARVLTSTETSGYFTGSAIGAERVFVITSVEIGSEEFASTEPTRAMHHRAFQFTSGQPGKRLVRWVRLTEETEKKFLSGLTRAEFASTFGIELKEPLEYICTFEQRGEESRIRAYILMVEEGGRAAALPMSLMSFGVAGPSKLPTTMAETFGPRKVAIAGVGSGGGEIALQLATAGVGKLDLFDFDRLESGNYGRHILSRRDLGRAKVHAVKGDIDERELGTEVTAHYTDVVGWANGFRDYLRETPPHLLVCATDSRISRRFLNYCAVKFGVPLVIAGTLDSGRIGEIMTVRPRVTACYECIRLEFGASLDASGSPDRSQHPYEGGEQVDLQASAFRFDVALVASLATRSALALIAPAVFPLLPTSYVAWGREVNTFDAPFNFASPLSVHHVPVAKRSDCPVCGINDGESTAPENERFDAILASLHEV